jgi:hypothetical protein
LRNPDVAFADHLGSGLRRVVYHLAAPMDPSWWRVADDVERADFGIDLHLSSGIIGIGWQIEAGDLRLWCEPRSVGELLVDQPTLDVSELSRNWTTVIGMPLTSLELSPPAAGDCSALVTFGARTVFVQAAEFIPGTEELRACSDEILVWFGGRRP